MGDEAPIEHYHTRQGTRKRVHYDSHREGGTGTGVIEEGQAVTALNRRRALAKGLD